MKKILTNTLLVLASLLMASFAFADANPRDAVGNWINVDDNTGEEKAIVKIEKREDGLLYGTLAQIFDPAKAKRTCTPCTDDRKDVPVMGMEIIRGAKKVDGDWDWKEGNILDPENGKVYRLRMWTSKDGKQLSVRGYLGPFYRTQYWKRVEIKPEAKKVSVEKKVEVKVGDKAKK